MAPASTTPFFGRAYALVITPQKGPSAGNEIVVSSDQFEPEALRFTFELTQLAFSAFWDAQIEIYNCDGPISSGPSAGVNLFEAVIQEGDLVRVCAGYQADYPAPNAPPVIWEGQVFYTIKDRLDVTDQRLTLHCLMSRALTTQNFINETLPALSTQFSQAQFIAQKSLNPIGLNTSQVQPILGTSQQLPRAKTFFGNPHPYLHNLAKQSSALSWFDSKTWNAATLSASPLGELAATYAPLQPGGGAPARVNGVTLSLIGTPQQTQLGVTFRVLLDPNVQVTAPIAQIKLASEFVRQAPMEYPLPKGGLILPLSANGQYAVIGVRFIGDTRGNSWYSEITAVSQIKSAIQLIAGG